jgi:hypothetical protein
MSSPSRPSLSRLDLLLHQLDESYRALHARMAGLTDEEYLWEPVPGCITLRERDGRWQPDRGAPRTEPPPFTTIARRLSHLTTDCLFMRWEYTFGGRALTHDDVEYSGTAAGALALFEDAYGRWRAGLGTLTEADLDVVGLSQMPTGLDPDLAFGEVLWWNNRELIHHGAEIAMMRDLWTHSEGGKHWS